MAVLIKEDSKERNYIRWNCVLLLFTAWKVTSCVYAHAYLFKRLKTRLKDNEFESEQVRNVYCVIINITTPISCEI